MFIPTTKDEMRHIGWDGLDVILVTGDAYIDSPYVGVAIIGQLLMSYGFRVGIIAQPDSNTDDITRLGEPELFWGVTAGAVDSMVSNYTAARKKRKQDDLTPGGVNNKRPDRASIVYTGLIRKYFKQTVPVVLGGIEASLRRIAHYDFWSNKIRRSLLFDAKADYLIYGMGEHAVIELAERMRLQEPVTGIRGICYIDSQKHDEYEIIPSYEECIENTGKYEAAFHTFYHYSDPHLNKGLQQQYGDRWLIHNPPAPVISTEDLDRIYELPYAYCVHPFYQALGDVRGFETTRFSVTTHRGCYGECNFCAIALHQGREVVSRSESSILKEITTFTKDPAFKGNIHDVGGPTANMYGVECSKKKKHGSCRDKRCLFPRVCKQMRVDLSRQMHLLKRIRNIPGIKKVFIASGVRYDIIFADQKYGEKYLEELVSHHISGQMKVAPEHISDRVLKHMGKPGKKLLRRFKELFIKLNRKVGKKQFLTYYFIAAHPGCTQEDMFQLKDFVRDELKLFPEQVQIFTPTPSTYSTLMYYTGIDPFSGKELFVERDMGKKEKQKAILKKSKQQKSPTKRSKKR